MRRFLGLFLLGGLLVRAGVVTVAVAANASYAMPALIHRFIQTHPETTIRTVVGSSGKLTAQIRHGAPYQLFLSADMGYPEALRRSGEAVTEPKVYARGALVLFTAAPRNLSAGLKILGDPSIRRIALANPRTAPYGRAAKEALQKSGLWKRLQKKFVYGESVGQTVIYALKAADAGLIAKSALHSPAFAAYRAGRNWVDVDPALYRPIEQGIVLLKAGASDPEARAFYAFLLGPEAGRIFRTYGYLRP
jgi:molybdate transport system substrate-binding protein